MTDTLATIRWHLTQLGWTAAELQRRSGISYRAAWQIRTGNSSRIDWRTLNAVLTALGIELFGSHVCNGKMR